MATTWANEAPKREAADNRVLYAPPPPPPTRSTPPPPPPAPGARYRPEFTVTGDRVDFDRVMLESWRPKAVRPQTDPFYVPGPGSEPPPMEEMLTVEPLSRWRVALLATASAMGLLVVAGFAYGLGRHTARDQGAASVSAELATPVPAVGTAAPRPRQTMVEVGEVTIEPLPSTSTQSALAPTAVAASGSGRDRIRPLASAEHASDAIRARPTRRAHARRASPRPVTRQEARATTTAAAAPKDATGDAPPTAPEVSEAALGVSDPDRAPQSTGDEPREAGQDDWHAPPMAGWDDVLSPAAP